MTTTKNPPGAVGCRKQAADFKADFNDPNGAKVMTKNEVIERAKFRLEQAKCLFLLAATMEG